MSLPNLLSWLLAITITTTQYAFAQSSDKTIKEAPIENIWVVREISKTEVIASVSGLNTFGDKLKVRFVKGRCDEGNLLTTVFTTANHPEILQLEDKLVSIKFMGDDAFALVHFSIPFLGGHSSLVDLNWVPVDGLKYLLKRKNPIEVEFIGSNEFALSEYFDVRFNSWSNLGLSEALDRASEICKTL